MGNLDSKRSDERQLSVATSEAIRKKILEAANAEAPDWLPRSLLLQVLKGMAESEIDREVYYLEEKGCLRHRGEAGSRKPWTEIQITANGIDVVDGKTPL